MSLESIHIPENPKLTPLITVFGVGGAGCNAVQNMKDKGLDGVDFVIANTDAQSLSASSVGKQIQLGPKTTQGLGAGSDPEVGLKSAEESAEQIRDSLDGAHMLFITAGMGGGTGTGAAPVIARIAREMDILTVGVVTKPFIFEGAQRQSVAEAGVEELRRSVHTSVIIPNQNLFQVSNERTTTTEAFMKADDVLYEGVKGITDLMIRPGKINLDFADVRAVMLEMGSALMGTGEDSGENRAKVAAQRAMTNQLLEETRLYAAKGVLINIIGGEDLTLFDLNDASEEIRSGINPGARIIIGSTIDPEYEGTVKVSLLAAGLNGDEVCRDEPLVTALPDADELWDSDDTPDETDAEVVCEEDFDVPSGFEPSVDWPHAQGAVETVPSQGSAAAQDRHHEALPQQADRDRRQTIFVAPRAAGAKAQSAPPQFAVADAESGTERESAAASRLGRGKLGGVIRRMTSGAENYDDSSDADRFFISERFPGESGSRSDADRKVPAFMRRQAN